MSITLYISSKECDTATEEYVVNFLDVTSQVYKTYNKVKYGKYMSIESGFCIKIFDIDNITFKEMVWKPLKKRFNLKCAYVKKEDDYRGCILNWPGLFRPTICSKL